MTRKEAQETLINGLKNQMEKQGKTENDYCVFSPKKGKNAWTFGEMIEAIRCDIEPEEYGSNPIDGYMKYVEWKERQTLQDVRNRVNK